MEELDKVRSRAQSMADGDQEAMIIYREERGALDIARASWYAERGYPGIRVETVRPRYRYIDDVKRRNARLGHHWFEPDTMRFFGSRVHDSLYVAGERACAYFVTSEKPPHGRRAYSVRRANPDGSINTVGEFCGFRTGRQAHARAAWIAKWGPGHSWALAYRQSLK